jgi:TPP-dependent pyruvate/acetoin dehydrogenase alpha subunit
MTTETEPSLEQAPGSLGACPVDWLRTMVLIREFESVLDPLVVKGLIPGGVHLALGQEGVAVGAISALDATDLVSGSHRSHHHALAKGLSPAAVMAELFGRATGVSGGRGGTMHLAGWDVGYLGGNGIVGAGLGIAMGAALAAHLQGLDQVAVGFFGDGAVNTGRTWETLNLAAAWALPLVAVCENNLYAVETPTANVTAGSVIDRAGAFGMTAVQVDGQDVLAVHKAMRAARARAAAGGGPTFIEALTYRYEGHSTAQVVNYRTGEEVEDWRKNRDPIDRLRIALMEAGRIDQEAYDSLVAEAREEFDRVVSYATGSEHPGAEAGTAGVTDLELGMVGPL